MEGELDSGQHELFDRLKDKTKRYLSETHLETGVFPTGEPYKSVKDKHLKGVLTYDSANVRRLSSENRNERPDG